MNQIAHDHSTIIFLMVAMGVIQTTMLIFTIIISDTVRTIKKKFLSGNKSGDAYD